MTKRTDFLKVLKIDTSFLPILRRLYPFDIVRVGHTDVVTKRIPIGSVVRDFPVRKLVFWQQHPNVGGAELEEAVESRNADPLDWRSANLFSTWQDQAALEASGVPEETPEGVGAGGRTFVLREKNGGRK
jgi:hypothetical protein